MTLFRSVQSTDVGYNKPVEYVFERIRSGKSKENVNKIRAGKSELKSSLPGVCFNGSFRYRNTNGLIGHSGLCIFDFDKIPDGELSTTRSKIEKDKYTFACWLSPSGNGLKVLVRIPAEPDNHKLYYQCIADHFDSEFIDRGGHDLPRFCFESYDPKLYVNFKSKVWTEKAVEDVEDIGSHDCILPIRSENRIIDNLKKWWETKHGHIKGKRNDNLFKLAIAFNDFGINRDEAERVLLQYEEPDFGEKEILRTIKSAYENESAFGTKFFEDDDTKKKIEKAIRNGKKEKEIVQNFPGIDKKSLKLSIDNIKENLSVLDFWDYYNGAIKLSPHKYKFWLQQHNFFKYYPSDSNTYTFIHKDQNLLDETSDKKIKDYVLNYLLNREDIGFRPYDFMANSTKYFSSEYLSLLETAEVEVKEDTQDICYIYFRNCVAKVSKTKIEEIDYVDIDGFIWKRQIIDKEFNKVDHHKAIFRTFLWKIAGESVERYNSLKSVVGYMLHSYKTSANNKAIIFNDETISENPNGGSGKGIFWNALSQMKRLASIDGKTFEFTKSFPYQTVSTDTQILVFDDVKKNFNFESLFSLITEGITLEYKGQDAIKLPVQQSPKILITTNYTVKGSGGSFDRRKFEIELSGHFNTNHTPLDEFGHLLFDDWDKAEWDRFYSFMLNCVQYYLNNGLQSYDHINLTTRKFIGSTCQEFFEWVNDDNVPFNVQIDKKTKFNEFIEEYSDLKKWLTQRTFTRWIEMYAKHNGYNYISGRTHNARWIRIDNPDAPIPEEDGLPF